MDVDPARREADPFRDLVVPLLGPLWAILPVAVWLLEFGHLLLARLAGEAGSTAGRLAALLLVAGWCVRAGAFASRAPLPIDGATLRCVLLLLLQFLLGAGLLLVLGPGIAPIEGVVPRSLLGGALILTAWLGLTGLSSPARRLALSFLRGARKRR